MILYFWWPLRGKKIVLIPAANHMHNTNKFNKDLVERVLNSKTFNKTIKLRYTKNAFYQQFKIYQHIFPNHKRFLIICTNFIPFLNIILYHM